MRIILVGASGDIGRLALAELEPRHEVISAGRASGDIHVDIANRASIESMYRQTGPVDAVISTAGAVSNPQNLVTM